MLAFLCLLVHAAAATAANPMFENHPLFANRIVGGCAYDISQVPYQVSLQVQNSHICGGSIINAHFILTASHCIIGNEGNWPYMNVRVGSSLNNQGGQFIKVKKMYSHPSYDPSNSWINDIAILELSAPIHYSSNARPVTLPNAGAPLPIGAYATASGWGRLGEGGASPSQLQGVQIPVQDSSVCEHSYGSAFDRSAMVCAASLQGGQSTCQGDSGGPLVYQGVQYGVVSWAAGCATPGYPTVFAHVANLRQFITDAVGI